MRKTVLGLAVLAVAAPAGAATSTKGGTIVPVSPSEPGGDFVFLKNGPGEGTVVREDRNVELLIADPRRSKAKLRVVARPRKLAAGKRTTVRVRVTLAGAAVRGARLRLGSAKARTNARGRARLTVTLRRTGVIRARKGAARGRAVITVAR